MSIFEEESRKRLAAHEIGQDLALLSADELRSRVEMLRAEIARLEEELAAKHQTKSAAEALFRRT
ncbi:DUF1192 domain-containing protein [Tianweitania sediminis]|uniref:DUF1192 domain-containing protein n=1 Tax=Tianweitania sediminis TaxID=1502156 RepID=A0A8J7UK32_9HYPH|nr:DUF1192 domain-containing protein [Tianweitania sediminis]